MVSSVTIFVVPHQQQRYDTAGDWTLRGQRLEIKVSQMPTSGYESLLALHEYIEATLCLAAGITPADVDDWDFNYSGSYAEPGEDPACPYHKQHMQAETQERALAEALGLDWFAYIDALDKLEWRKSRGAHR